MKLSLSGPASQFDVETISPFGVVIRPSDHLREITDLPVPMARDLTRTHRLLIFRGFQPFPTAQNLAHYAESWGQVLSWPFGQVLELVEHERPADHVFDNTGVSLHWDGMFVDQIPEFQIFQCVQAPENDHGGRTIFCDTTRVLKDAPAPARKKWRCMTLTYRIKKETHYGGRAVSPLVVRHPDRGFPTIRYLEPVPTETDYVNRPLVEFGDVPAEKVPEIERQLHDSLYDPRHCLAHQWQTGDLVVADNYTLLHGREPYTSRCGRHLRRVHVLGDPPLTNSALQ